MSEGPATQHRIFALDEWATMLNPQRVQWLRHNMIDEYSRDPRLRWFTADLLRSAGVSPRDYPATAAALLAWVQQSIYYTNEAGESIQTPWVTIEKRTGDCDDAAVLLAALAASVDLPWKFVLLGRDKTGRSVRWMEGQPFPKGNPQFFHIYIMLGWPAGSPLAWASAEPTLRGAPLGFDPGLHGLQIDRHGRPHLPPEWGGPHLAPSERLAVPKQHGGAALGGLRGLEPTETGGFLSKEHVKDLSLKVFEAAVSAIGVTIALSWLDSRRRKARRSR